MQEILLGVNIDHVATIRNARGGDYPDPVQAAFIAEQAGAHGITTHLREDRRHITDRDVRLIAQIVTTRLNLEMAISDDIMAIAKAIAPKFACLVPEKRQEVTTEGGLDVVSELDKVRKAVADLKAVGTTASLFIDPERDQIKAASDCGASFIELHTGAYANATDEAQQLELERIIKAVEYAQSLDLTVNAGHGLNYHNVAAIARIKGIYELNIGHSIISRAIFTGLENAIKEMYMIMRNARAEAYLH